MTYAKTLSLAVLMLALAGCKTVPQATEARQVSNDPPELVANESQPESVPEITLEAEGIKVGPDTGKRVFATAVNSQRLTQELRAALAKQGMTLVTSYEQAQVLYELDGGFDAIRTTSRRAKTGLGTFVERPERLYAKSTHMSREGDVKTHSAFGDADFDKESCPQGKCSFVYFQSAEVELRRFEGGVESTTTVSVRLIPQKYMHPTVMLEVGLDALSKSVGLSENPFSIKGSPK
jgi:hypothetical protein